MARYRTLEQFEHLEEHEHSHAVAEEMAELRRRQNLAVRRNLHNFGQLERAGFPDATNLEVNYWVVNRTLGFLARRAQLPVLNGEFGTRVITILRKGYYVPRPGGGFAIRTDGTVYQEAGNAEERGTVEVHRAPRRGLSLQRFENPGTPLAEFKGEDKHPSVRPFATAADIERIRVRGTENFASAFERVTKDALMGAGVEYVPLDLTETPSPAPVVPEGITEEMPTAPMPVGADDPTEVRPPSTSSGRVIINPLDYM